MFRTLIYPSSGACDCVVELPHRSSRSQFVVCWSFCCGCYLVVFVLLAEAHNKWNKIASDIKLVFHSSTYSTSFFTYVQQFSFRSYSIRVVLAHSQKRKVFTESIFGTKYMLETFLQSVINIFIVAVNTCNQRVAVKVTHKNACTYSCDIPFSCLRYYTQLQGKHKGFPWLQTFITRKLLYVEYKYTFLNVTQEVFFYNTLVHFNMCPFCCTENV